MTFLSVIKVTISGVNFIFEIVLSSFSD